MSSRTAAALPLSTIARARIVPGVRGVPEVASRVRAWLAHARHGHTRALCQRVLGELAFGASEAPGTGEVAAEDGGGEHA